VAISPYIRVVLVWELFAVVEIFVVGVNKGAAKLLLQQQVLNKAIQQQ
jgi:hypothetical protein